MSEVIVRSIEELREAYLEAVRLGQSDHAAIFKYALTERLEALSARIGSNPRAESPDQGSK